MESDIEQYRHQLSIVQQQISVCTNESDKLHLIELETNLKELIDLTEENDTQNKLESEYNLFKEELALEENQNDDTSETIDSDLNSLVGMKCQAPFRHAWSDQAVFHNALVFTVTKSDENITSTNDIKLAVMFTHPTHINMKPCPYFLEGKCRFSSEKCKFSHGEVVSLESLKEFKEPDFSGLTPGSRVLIKQPDELWGMATLKCMANEKCVIKLDSSSTEIETELCNVYPVGNGESLSDSDSGEEDNNVSFLDVSEMPKEIPLSGVLGSWERFTKGFGSRMMKKMGYVHGSGLGINGRGRVEPVPAVVYPPKKSLDHCMMLKENSKDDDLFKAERIMRRKQLKHEENLAKAYEREKLKTDVFSYLNSNIGSVNVAGPSSTSLPAPQQKLEKISKKGLTISSFSISENVMKLKKERKKLLEGLQRHSTNSPFNSAIKEKIKSCDEKIEQCELSEKKITEELQLRNNRKKLTVF